MEEIEKAVKKYLGAFALYQKGLISEEYLEREKLNYQKTVEMYKWVCE